MKYKKPMLWVASISIICVVAVFLTQPVLIKAIVAKYKSTDHFLVLENDTRIRFEEPAKGNALILDGILSDSQKTVEGVLGASFKKTIEVYVCSSQESFNGYVFLSKNVRGAVYWGKLFLSPGAFSRGSLSELTTHELTHYLFYTHLGERAHIEGIPLWFREGIAVFTANGGAKYTEGEDVFRVMSSKERESYLAGNINFWFTTKDPRDAVTKNGTVNWFLYRVGGLFVHFLHDSEPDKFEKLIRLLLSGTEFSEAIHLSYGEGTKSLLNKFTHYLTTYKFQSELE